jgi:dihydropyrimidinase
MAVDIVIQNGVVVTPGGIVRGGVAVEDERIVAVGSEGGLPSGRRSIDAQGHYIIPGLIDAHVHLGPGGLNWPDTAADFSTESRAAAYGGVTTALVFLFSLDSYLPVFDDLVAMGEANSLVDFAYHAGINSAAQIAEIPALVERGVTSFKHFFTANRRAGTRIIEALDAGLMYASFATIAAAGGIAQVHAEDIDLIQLHETSMRASRRTDLAAWSLSRPPLCEALAIAQVALIAKETGARAYIVHLSSAAGVEAVERAQRAGVDLVAETCPQYLTLDQGMERDVGCWGKLIPPLRTAADQERLWQALRDGTVTTLGTDHVPLDLAAKQCGGDQFGDIWKARLGIANGMEHLLPVMLSAGLASGRLDIEALVRLACANTAKVFGLYPRKGAIQAGSDADLVIVDPTIEGAIGPGFYHGVAHEWSPFFGFPIRGLARLTMVRGTVVMEDRELVDDTPRGRYLRRSVAEAAAHGVGPSFGKVLR